MHTNRKFEFNIWKKMEMIGNYCNNLALRSTVGVSFVVIMGGVVFGYGIASIAGSLDFIKSTFNLTEFGEQVIVGILVLGCFVGAAMAGAVSALWGRRRSIMLATGLGMMGHVLIVADLGMAGLLAGRSIVGLCIGLLSMVVPMYAAEATLARYRGAVVSLFQLAITLGILGAYAVSLYFAAVLSWPFLLGAGFVPVGLCLLAIQLLPESPRWLSVKGDRDGAFAAAKALGLAEEWRERPPTAGGDVTTGLGSLRRGSTIAVLLFCSALFVLQNLSGIDGILYYAPRIFRELGFSEGTAALTATFGLGLVNVLATIAAIVLVDRLGRRPLLIFGSVAMATGLAIVVGASLFDAPWLGLGGLALFIAAFAFSLGPLPYVLMSELFPTQIRESGIAVASATSWLFNALIAFTFLSLVGVAGLSGAIGAFLVVCLIAVVFCLAFVPETRGASLEEIEAGVLSGRPLRRLGS